MAKVLQDDSCQCISLPGLLLPAPLTSQQATVDMPSGPETPRYSQASLTWSLVGSLFLSPWSWCIQGFVCALQEAVSQVLWKLCNQILLTFKVRFPGDSQPLYQILKLRSLMWGLEPLQQCENFRGIIILLFVGHPPSNSMVGLMVASTTKMYATCHASQNCHCQCPCLHGRSLPTHVTMGDPQTLTGRSGLVS